MGWRFLIADKIYATDGDAISLGLGTRSFQLAARSIYYVSASPYLLKSSDGGSLKFSELMPVSVAIFQRYFVHTGAPDGDSSLFTATTMLLIYRSGVGTAKTRS